MNDLAVFNKVLYYSTIKKVKIKYRVLIIQKLLKQGMPDLRKYKLSSGIAQKQSLHHKPIFIPEMPS